MHKKDHVKQVIETYIRQGRDFYELTPSFLQSTDELKGFSERTLKRGRTEFKKERPDLMKKQSRDTASVHKRIFRFLEKSPQATSEQLVAMFPKIQPRILTVARKLWEQENPPETGKTRTGSLRRAVLDFLAHHPDADMETLGKEFPEAKKNTLGNYLETWRKGQAPKRKVTLKQRVMDYMNSNPEARLQQLKEAFPETKAGSINTYYSLWRNHRIQEHSVDPPAAEKPSGSSRDIDEIIQALKTTIEAQRKTIEVLKSQNEILRDRQNIKFPELEGMTSEEVRTVERVVRTFIRGIRNN